MRHHENTPQLRTDALRLQLELEAGCYCHALSPERRPCASTRAAEMIGRLLAVLTTEDREKATQV